MEHKNLSELSDQELLEAAKKMKPSSITNAVFIGILAGIVFYSIINNTFGFLMLIPLFIVYKMINDPKNKKNKELDLLLKQRNLHCP